jgi:copper homeostasis protein
MPNSVRLEVCVDSVESAIASEKGGAQRVELCSALAEGGITPSAGLIAMVRKQVTMGLHVLIRPRAGDFCYSAEEFEVMRRDVLLAKQLGANGVVFGILDPDANIDVARATELVALAQPMAVTFHRAFDLSRDFFAALEDVAATGADRILTSGGERTAEKGVDTLARLVKAAAGRMVIMAAGGIRAKNVHDILEKSGVHEIHAALQSSIPGPMRARNERIVLGSIEGTEHVRFVVLAETVSGLLAAAAKTGSASPPNG